MSEQEENEIKPTESIDSVRYNALLQGVSQLAVNFKEFRAKFDSNKDGKIDIDEIKAALKHPIGKRYFLIFIVVVVNILVAIIQFYATGKPIDVNTLVTLIFSTGTVIFAGYIENVNQSVLNEKQEQIEKLKIDLLESHKNSIKKDTEIEILRFKYEQLKGGTENGNNQTV